MGPGSGVISGPPKGEEGLISMATRGKQAVGKGMKVYTSDGQRVGKVGEVREREELSPPPEPSPFRPLRNPERVAGDVVDLDITGTPLLLGGDQPTQAQLGVRPGASPVANEAIDTAKGEDVGTDYKEMGETLDTRNPGELRDPRVLEGYFKLDIGLDSPDLYVPLGAVTRVTRDREVVLGLTREQLNDSGWAAKPPV